MKKEVFINQFNSITPDVMGTQHTVEVIALNVIGGRGSFGGPLLAAFMVIIPFEYLKSLMEVLF